MSTPSRANIPHLDSKTDVYRSDQRKELEAPGSRSPVKYLTVQEVTCAGAPAFGARLDALMEALLSLEAADSAIEDPDLTADLTSCSVDVEMMVEAADPAAAMVKALAALRAAIHTIGDATPCWETTLAVMHVTPAEAPEQLLTSA